MTLELMLNFNGNCREAGEFYAKVFQSEWKNVMTFEQAPPSPGYTVAQEDKNKVLYSDIVIGDRNVMLMDMPAETPLVVGNNVSPCACTTSVEETTRIFNALKEGGQVYMELQKTFYSECYGMVADQFGIIWQVLYYIPQTA